MMRAKHFAFGIRQVVRAAIAIGIWDSVDVAGEWRESGLVWICLAGQRHSHPGASMKRILKTDHSWTLGVRTRNFDRIFYALRAAVHEKGFLRTADWRQRIQLL